MLQSWFTKDWKTLETPMSLWRITMHWTLKLPQVFKHNIVWRYRNSRAKATLHCPCWQAPMILLRTPSSWWKVLRNSEPIFPYGLSKLGILSSRRDPLRWTYVGIPSCWKCSSPGFDTTVHGSWRPIFYLLWGLVDQSVLGPTPTLSTLTWPEFLKKGPLLQMATQPPSRIPRRTELPQLMCAPRFDNHVARKGASSANPCMTRSLFELSSWCSY